LVVCNTPYLDHQLIPHKINEHNLIVISEIEKTQTLTNTNVVNSDQVSKEDIRLSGHKFTEREMIEL
jgi:hypothetical protein